MKMLAKRAPASCRNLVRSSLRTRRGNSLAEVAVFGTIALSALAVMVSYGRWFDLNILTRMKGFRQALAASSGSNRAVTATAPSTFTTTGSDTQISSATNQTVTAFVQWCDRCTYATNATK